MGALKKNIKDLSPAVRADLFASLGLKSFVSRQVYLWLFKKAAQSFEEMTDLSKETKKILSDNFYVSALDELKVLKDDDGTCKFLFGLEDGNKIEAVMIPVESGRLTLCISSQVGCLLGCEFCRTAQMGFVRDLTPSEMIDQVIYVKRYAEDRGSKLTNLVFMGMGEPLNNYENVRQAITVIKDESGIGMARRRITISTAGIVPGIRRMTEDDLGVKLAVSLNAATEEVRRKIMPIANKYSIGEIIDACLAYAPCDTRLRTTFEYVLLAGINDSIDDAKQVVRLMKRLPSKVNLIPFNEYSGSQFERITDEKLQIFYDYLVANNVQVNIRKSRGKNILAACGQLAGE